MCNLLETRRKKGRVMKYSLFAVFDTPGVAVLSTLLADVADVDLTAEVFRPAPEQPTTFDDGDPPALVVQVEAKSLAPLHLLSARPEFREADDLGLFRTLITPVGGVEAPREAPLSFLVRYFGPMLDEAAFQKAYAERHPPILATFPAIRNVRVYLPVPEGPKSAIRLCNEVVFDDLAALNHALASDVLAQLRADSAGLPARGASAHHAMLRETP
jgi:hypothetical protein